MSAFTRISGLAVLAIVAALLVPSATQAVSRTGGITLPGPATSPKIAKILPRADRPRGRSHENKQKAETSKLPSDFVITQSLIGSACEDSFLGTVPKPLVRAAL